MAAQTNLAAVLHGIEDLRIEEVPMPEPGPHDVIVQVLSVGVCGSDVHFFLHGRIGDSVVKEPLVLGHESGGVIVAVGSEVDSSRVGQRVAMEPGVPCGRCEECRRGVYNLCADVIFFASPPVHGSLVQYLALNEAYAFPIPDSMSDDAAAMLEPLSVAIWACRKGKVSLGSKVLITGAGPIGVVCGLVAKASGAAWVGITDVNPARLKLAESFGFDTVIDGREVEDFSSYGADVLLECSGVQSVVTAGIKALRPLGTAVLVGLGPSAEQSLPVMLIAARELNITGTFRYAHTWPEAIDLVTSGRIDVDALVGARFPLAEADAAFRMGRTDPSVLKTVIRVQE
jgi:L-iditol 2-dehydrogenase